MSSRADPSAVSGPRPLAVNCVGLVKRFGSLTAVSGLDVDIYQGECFGLLGLNGAGKTTTLEIFEGLQAPSAGRVEILGRSWSRHARELRERVSFTLQDTQLTPRATVFEALELFGSFYPRGPGPEALMAHVQLDDKRDTYFEHLSGGQKQRLALACALAGDPELLFLDEPTSGLDPQSRRQVWDLVARLRSERRTVVLTTHYMEEAELLCDRIGVIDGGRLIALGAPDDLIASLGGAMVEFDADGAALPLDDLAALGSVQGVSAGPAGGYQLATEQPERAIPDVVDFVRARGAALRRISTRRPTLEDVFVHLTGKHLRD